MAPAVTRERRGIWGAAAGAPQRQPLSSYAYGCATCELSSKA